MVDRFPRWLAPSLRTFGTRLSHRGRDIQTRTKSRTYRETEHPGGRGGEDLSDERRVGCPSVGDALGLCHKMSRASPSLPTCRCASLPSTPIHALETSDL